MRANGSSFSPSTAAGSGSYPTPDAAASTRDSWPTATTMDAHASGDTSQNEGSRRKPGTTLTDAAARNWQTPTSSAGGNSSRGHDRKGEQLLAGQAKNWPEKWSTPVTNPNAPNLSSNQKSAPPSLGKQAKQWATPRSSKQGLGDSGSARRRQEGESRGLHDMAKDWPTPIAHNERGSRSEHCLEDSKAGRDLVTEAAKWPTPASRDSKGENSELHCKEKGSGRKHMDQLPNFVAHSPLAQAISKGGKKSSESIPRLNPRFVEYLMGWPLGMTDCGSPATESYLSWLQSHSELLRLVSELRGI